MISEAGFESADFHRAGQAVSTWRGHCISTFARAERAATEALIRLAADCPDVNLPHLVGRKFDALDQRLKTFGDPIAAAASAMLGQFRAHDDLRVFLCHGEPKVTLDRDGRWQVVLTLVGLRCGRASTRMLIVDELQAANIARSLHRDQQRFSSRIACIAPAATALSPTELRIATI